VGQLPLLWFWGAIAWTIVFTLLEDNLFTTVTKAALPVAKDTSKGPKPKATTVFLEIIRLCAPDWPIFLSALTGLCIAASGESLIPFLLGKLIDSVAFQHNPEDFNRYALYLVITALLTSFFAGLRGASFILMAARFSVRLQQRLFEAVLRQETAFFDETKTGDIVSRLSNDCSKVRDQVQLNVNVFLRSVLSASFTLAFMGYISWKLMLTAFICVPVVTVVSKYMGDISNKLAEQSQEVLAKATSACTEAISSVRTVKAFAAEDHESRRFREVLNDYIKVTIKKSAFYVAYAGLTFYFLPEATTCLVLFYGGRLVTAGEIGGGDLVSFAFYMQSLFNSFSSLGDIYTGLVEAVGASAKVFEWIFREPKIVIAAAPLKPETCEGEVLLKGVTFEYPTRPGHTVLSDLSLHVRPGEVVALCGTSGGGKSSCMQLLQRFYEPQAGEVLLDGRPLKDLDNTWYHRHVALVAQEPVLFGCSIKKNILYGLEEDAVVPTDEEVIEAAKLANAHEFIMSFPKGYDTEVGERGAQLSGGQKQRVSIARALVRHPKVLLLDEATSALDAESEFVVQEAIDRMIAKGNMTVIVIAHRLSTIRNATNIVVVAGGKVAEQGTHEQLLALGGTYAQLVQKQMADRTTPASPAVAVGKDAGVWKAEDTPDDPPPAE